MFPYCPQCKSAKINFDSQRYWVCSDCDFVYFHNTAAGVAAIIRYENELLFTVRAKEPGKGKLDLPGGFVDYHESLEQGLSRELEEELGLIIQPSQWRYFCSFPNQYLYKKINYQTIDSVFICHLTEKPKLNLEAHEISDVNWLDIEHVKCSEMAFQSLAKAVENFIQDINT
ncbi:NUDIX hydrolase [Aliiglaciecola lipolytica]|uniref:Nudix hydrolase domain-containing protein n=1 Tax=Aliiglaciecola lipolytica E3 TaxID=1127673 RepID=K6XNK5_9ALTE|nr:NUDIX domain-containing protein [Aliiglaciecola lipolytica]GAC13261.1 hypothetical protein GLIP_0615 [Aliiglaciecola lipolytica E3]